MFRLKSPKPEVTNLLKIKNLNLIIGFLLIIFLALSLNRKFFSSVEIIPDKDKILIHFSLSKQDQKNLEVLLNKAQINWPVSDLAIKVDDTTLETLNNIGKISFRVYFSLNEIKFNTKLNLEDTSKSNSWQFKELAAVDSLIYLQFPKKFLPNFPGKEAYNYVKYTTAAIIVPSDGLKIALFGQINDNSSLKKTIEDFRNLPKKGIVQERYEGAASGYSEGLVGNIKTYTLTTPDSKITPTFAVVKDNLITTFGTNLLKEIITASKNSNSTLDHLETFKETVEILPANSSASLFINTKKIKNYDLTRFLSETKPYLDIELNKDITKFLNIFLERVENFSFVINSNKSEGFIKLQ